MYHKKYQTKKCITHWGIQNSYLSSVFTIVISRYIHVLNVVQWILVFILQEYSFQITLRQQWNDGRLSFKDKLLGMEGKYNTLKYVNKQEMHTR